MRKLNNKGFAITAVAYTLLIFFILLITLILLLLRNLDTSLTTLTKDIKQSINNIKYISGTVQITGDTIYGETLTAIPTITSLLEEETDDITYTYQWYTNDVQSIIDAEEIAEATNDSLILNAAQYNKYICVKAISNSNKYDDVTFDTCTLSPVVKRQIVVTAESSSKIYDGTALTNSICTATNLAFHHTVECEMTSNSSITNVGSVSNEISSVTIWNDGVTDKVNNYYDITLVKGTLTVTSS